MDTFLNDLPVLAFIMRHCAEKTLNISCLEKYVRSHWESMGFNLISTAHL